jgi:hypothetical protein
MAQSSTKGFKIADQIIYGLRNEAGNPVDRKSAAGLKKHVNGRLSLSYGRDSRGARTHLEPG